MASILCPEPSSFSDGGLNFARQHARLDAREMNQAEFARKAPGYDAVLVRFTTRVSGDAMQGGRLKAILSPTTGLDHIDFEAVRRHKVRVYHLQGQKKFLQEVSATAELTVALMLAVLRNLPHASEAVKRGGWFDGSFRGHEVFGKTLGVVGYGRLGSKVARVAKALGMKLLAFDPFVKALPAHVERSTSLPALLERSDVVSLHVPLIPETVNMISFKEIALFKPGAVLINTSRGAIVDEDALLSALRTKRLSAAALDVLNDEGGILQKDGHPLLDYARSHTNLLITPHIGGATFESVEKTDLFILRRYFKDQGLRL